MTLNRRTTDPRQMTAAAFRVAREHLGLTTAWTAQHMGVQERTVHRWEAGVSPVPEGVRIEMEILTIAADRAEDDLARALAVQPEPALVTYRTDADYRRHQPGQPWTAAWHRAMVARVARRTPGATITYWDPR